MNRIVLIFLCFLAAGEVSAAYRVYQLKITPYDARGKKGKPRTVLSTVDHIQYESLYGSYRWDRVELVDHWYCPGDTSRRAFCKKPKERRGADRAPASYDKPKRISLPRNLQPVIP